jgi:hypothetical protein
MTLAEILHYLVEGISLTQPVRDKLHAAVDALETDVKNDLTGKPKQAAPVPTAPVAPVPPPLTAAQKAYYGITDETPVKPAAPVAPDVLAPAAPVPAAPAAAPVSYGSSPAPAAIVGDGPLTVDDEEAELEARLTALKAARTTPAAGA